MNDRRGFALPATIGALVIIGIMVTAGFFVAQQELRIGVASNHANVALNLAQAGANEVMANWNGYQLGNIPTWQSVTVNGAMDQGTWQVTITNRDGFIYFVDASGTVTEGGALWAGATRRIGVVTKMLFADISPPAALTTRGTTTVKGTALVDGHDATPASWGPYCTGVPTNDAPGIMTNDASVVTTDGKVADIDGAPPIEEDVGIVDETFTQFGDMDWAELTALAQAEGKNISSVGGNISTVEPDTLANGACNETLFDNWGDTLPSGACGAYFPLIYHDGPTLSIQGGGYGQGILLVDGNLMLTGDYLFYGLNVVQGDLTTSGNRNTVVGAVMASNSIVDDDQMISGTSEIRYSNCTVQRAILNNASLSRARPMEQRSWMDLTSVAN